MENKEKFILEMKQKIAELEKSWSCYTWDKWKHLLEETLKFIENNGQVETRRQKG